MQPPPTRYVQREGISIAYQVVGDGPADLLFSPGFISHLDLMWTEPRYSRFLGRLASFSRLILYDKPGTGLSDPTPHHPTVEERAADIVAVLDAAGSEHAVLLGNSEGGPPSLLLAATRPERVSSLVLSGTFAVLPPSAPEAYSPELVARVEATLAELSQMVEHWDDGSTINVFAPGAGEVQRRAYGTFERAAASPSMARAVMDVWMQLDVREILASVRVPTLVVHIEGDRVVPVEAGRLLADGIPGARFISYPGTDHDFWFADCGPIIDEIERFVTGAVQRVEPDRILVTVLFTDVVGSTARAAELGDSAWRDLLERHDALTQRVVAERGGRVVKHTGDGALSAFDGPAKAIEAAEELVRDVGDLGLELRAGIHTGECEAIGDDLGGLAVHIGARVCALAGPGEIAVSSTVKELVAGSGMQFSDRGEHELKGVPGRWRVHLVGAGRAPLEPIGSAQRQTRASDRVTLALARRAPRAMRFGARLASRRRPPA